ncbi:MAG: cytidylate kinase-like family protein [Chloroflexi bacterium]|nr:cytidylate kinase-like family protein [Chloroflexota bacterium]
MPIVTVSRQLASGGQDIAAGIAKALNLRFVDREIINRAAIQAGVPEMALHELEYEGRRGVIEQIIDVLRAMPAIPPIDSTRESEIRPPATVPLSGIFTPPLPHVGTTMDDYVRIVGLVILDLAKQGDVVIVGQAGQVLLKDRPDTLHLQVIASMSRRIKVLMEREGLTHREATERITASDRARADYLRRYYGVNWLDPQLYDLVIRTDHISTHAAIQLVVNLIIERSLRDSLNREV